jgi:hypothetical protein
MLRSQRYVADMAGKTETLPSYVSSRWLKDKTLIIPSYVRNPQNMFPHTNT